MSDFYDRILHFVNSDVPVPVEKSEKSDTQDTTITLTTKGALAYTPEALTKRAEWYRIITKVANAFKSNQDSVALQAATDLKMTIEEYTPDDITDITITLAHLRDIREGLGERNGFVSLMVALQSVGFPEYGTIFKALLANSTKDYFRLDDFIHIAYRLFLKGCPTFFKYFRFCIGDKEASFNLKNYKRVSKKEPKTSPEVSDEVLNCIELVRDSLRDNLGRDMIACTNHSAISLMGKWLPSINTSSRETRREANFIAQGLLQLDNVTYRKLCSKLRKTLNIVEHHVTQNTFEQIDYAKVPSLAQNRYRTIFLKKDTERYNQYIKDVTEGKAKLHAGAISAADLVCKAHQLLRAAHRQVEYSESGYPEDVILARSALDAQWSNLPRTPSNALVCMDGSGSMYTGEYKQRPIDIAKALAIYISENNENFKNTFITFGDRVDMVTLKSTCFTDKVAELSLYDDCGTTNFVSVFTTLLSYAKFYHITPEQMPKTIIVVSDMQFDSQMTIPQLPINAGATPYQFIQNLYRTAGYTAPQMIFWCVTPHDALPISRKDVGATLCFGCNQNTLRYILEHDEMYTADDVINNILGAKRYEDIRLSIQDSLKEKGVVTSV